MNLKTNNYPFLLRFRNGLFCLQHNKVIPIPIHDISNKQQAIKIYKIVVLLIPLLPSVKKPIDKLNTININ